MAAEDRTAERRRSRADPANARRDRHELAHSQSRDLVPPMTLADLAPRLDQVRWRGDQQLVARCPAHDDRRPSFGAKEIDDRILVHCWTGCSTAAICAALNIELADLF